MKTNKKESSYNQIIAAIGHYNSGELDSAITLASAAENMVASSDNRYLQKQLWDAAKAAGINLNDVITWLKHHKDTDPDSVEITEFEAAITVARAITKFVATYGQSCTQFEDFLRRSHESGTLPVRLHQISN
jgi:hypothetical protein